MDIDDQLVGLGLAAMAGPEAERGEGGRGATAAAAGRKEEDILSLKDKEIAVGFAWCRAWWF